jgi:two-component system sensor histidine kinase CpxA
VIRSLYLKIFLWFCFVAFVVGTTIFVVTVAMHSQSLGPRWMTGVLDLYARSAVDFYRDNGKAGLARYLDEIEKSSRIRAILLDPESHDILGRGVPPGAEDVLKEARSVGHTRFRTGTHWRGASVISTDEGDYIFVAEIMASRNLLNLSELRTPLVRLTLALFLGGLLCLILARHITAPIRSLQNAAAQIARGDLSVRALPAISPRSDELSDLARNFDRMADRVQGLLQKQQELLGDISHELRSPLTRLGVSLELLCRGETDAVERMQSDLECVNSLIQQILTLTRLQVHDDGEKTEVAVNLRSIVESVAEDAAFEGKQQRKSVVIAHADDCWTHGDPALLRSCIENVVRNAVRHTKPETDVVIVLNFGDGEHSKSASVFVSDRGDGVPPDALPLVFEPFFRVPVANNQKIGGAGLGLTIAQKAAFVHGGNIVARNREAGGLEMEIRLPATSSRP